MGRFMIFCCGFLSVVILGATNDSVNRTHIYSTYPTHVTPDQLVCLNGMCSISDEECDTSYEVCEENPVYENETVIRYICHAVFFVDINISSVITTQRQCLNDPHSHCAKNCTLNQLLPSVYDCCCTGNLCNDVTVEFNKIDENTTDVSSTLISTPTMILPSATTIVLSDATTILPSATTTLSDTTVSLPNTIVTIPIATVSSLTPTTASSTTTLPTPTTPGPTNDSVNTTHIYSTYPTHVGPDELVCFYNNCTSDECDTKYEVCSENPRYENPSLTPNTCLAMFVVDADTGNITSTSQHCFVDDSACPNKCTPKLHTDFQDFQLYNCCCIGNLCNDVSLNLTAVTLQSTSSVFDQVMTTHITEPDSTVRATSDDDDESDYVPVIYGIAAGVCLLIVLTLVVVLTLAYCHYYRDRDVNCRKCISYNHFGG